VAGSDDEPDEYDVEDDDRVLNVPPASAVAEQVGTDVIANVASIRSSTAESRRL